MQFSFIFLFIGSCDQTTLSVGSLLDDDVWHDISISHENRVISLSVDRVSVHKNASGDYFKLNLDKFVSAVSVCQARADAWELFLFVCCVITHFAVVSM